MATITQTTLICDRCRKEMVKDFWKRQLFKMGLTKGGISSLRAMVPSTSSWGAIERELCEDCARELERWLIGKENFR